MSEAMEQLDICVLELVKEKAEGSLQRLEHEPDTCLVGIAGIITYYFKHKGDMAALEVIASELVGDK